MVQYKGWKQQEATDLTRPEGGRDPAFPEPGDRKGRWQVPQVKGHKPLMATPQGGDRESSQPPFPSSS